jgi:hypothetical protein
VVTSFIDELISVIECCSLPDNLEHKLLAPSTNTPKLQIFEVFDGFTVWLRVSSIKKKTSHAIPPDSMPVLIAAYWILAVISVHQNFGLFCSHNMMMFFKSRLHIDQSHKYVSAQ